VMSSIAMADHAVSTTCFAEPSTVEVSDEVTWISRSIVCKYRIRL